MLSVISPLLTILNQLKIYHWQTKSFSEHKALDDAYQAFGELVDEFVEVYQGIFGRIRSSSGSFVFELENLNQNDLDSSEIQIKIDEWVAYLQTFNQEGSLASKTDLLNIRDEMMATLNKLKYLITLK